MTDVAICDSKEAKEAKEDCRWLAGFGVWLDSPTRYYGYKKIPDEGGRWGVRDWRTGHEGRGVENFKLKV